MNSVTDWQLEQYVLAELPISKMREIQQQAASDKELRQRIEDIHQSNNDLYQEMPSHAFAAMVSNELANESKPKTGNASVVQAWLNGILDLLATRKFVTVASVAFSALFIALLAPSLIFTPSVSTYQTNGDTVRIKGLQPHFNVYRLINQESEVITVDDVLHENDVLQISYIAAGHRYGYIVSIDGNNVKTVHLADNDVSALLGADGEVRLSSGYKLDDAPRFERFFFFSSPERFDLTVIDQVLSNMVINDATEQGQFVFVPPIEQSFAISSMTFTKAPRDK